MSEPSVVCAYMFIGRYLGIAPRVLAMLFTGRAATYIATKFKHGNKAMLSATSGAVQLAGLSVCHSANTPSFHVFVNVDLYFFHRL